MRGAFATPLVFNGAGRTIGVVISRYDLGDRTVRLSSHPEASRSSCIESSMSLVQVPFRGAVVAGDAPGSSGRDSVVSLAPSRHPLATGMTRLLRRALLDPDMVLMHAASTRGRRIRARDTVFEPDSPRPGERASRATHATRHKKTRPSFLERV